MTFQSNCRFLYQFVGVCFILEGWVGGTTSDTFPAKTWSKVNESILSMSFNRSVDMFGCLCNFNDFVGYIQIKKMQI